jgi:hypothetical protein
LPASSPTPAGTGPPFAVTVLAGVLATALTLLAGNVLRNGDRGAQQAGSPLTRPSRRGLAARFRARTH